ncbi:uncharacterized protein YMR317W-like isoform X2 [Rana temporaria]|uniref:uncharacterized protein YMR317W-like isoform X2 n=1 Tax=Rana temporaria TaxID=8407 RepID=UPI001AAD92AD|nr:uncharacterized protein YMR317W-like isoform X2 [Rana temporaria]
MSSNPTTLTMKKKLIIVSHLRGLDGNRLEHFKKALCEQKPPPGAGLIKMENIEDKSIEEIVDFIFRCHTERHGPATIKKVLKEINENQIRSSIERELRNVKSKCMEGTQVLNIAPTNVLPTRVDVPFSEPSTKKLKRDQDGDAVPGASQHKEATASKSEGHRPAHSLLKKEPQLQVSPKQSTSTKNIFHTTPNKQFGVAPFIASSTVKSKCMEGTQVLNIAPTNVLPTRVDVPFSEPSTKKLKRDQDGDAVPGASQHKEATASKSEGHRPAHSLLKKEPQLQVSPKQSTSTKNIFHTTPNKQFGVAPFIASSTEPQPQVSPKRSTSTKNIFHTTPNKQFGVAPFHASSTEPEPQVDLKQGNFKTNLFPTASTNPFGILYANASFKKSKPRLNQMQDIFTSNISYTAPTKNWVVVSSNASKEPKLQVNPIQGNTSSIYHRAPSNQFGVASSHAFSKKPKPQVHPIQGNIASNISHTAPSKQMGIVPHFLPSYAFKEPEPQVNSIQSNITSNISLTALSKLLGVAPSNAFKEPEPQVKPIQSNITKNISLTSPSKQLEEAPSNAFKAPRDNGCAAINVSNQDQPLLVCLSPGRERQGPEPEPQVKPIQSNITSNIPLASPSKQLGEAPSNAYKEPEPQVKPIQSNIASNISNTAPSKQLGEAPSNAFKEPEPQVNPIQSNITRNISHTAPSKQLGEAPSNAFKEPEPQVNPIQSNITSNISLTAPSKQLGVAPSNAFKEPEPQVNPIQSNITSNIPLTAPSKQLGVAPSNAFKEPEPQVKPIQSNITSNIPLTAPSKQLGVAPSNAFKEPEPQVKPIQSNITSNISLTAPSKQLGVAPSNAFKEPEPQVNPIQSNIASNISLTSPSKQLGVAPSNAFKEPEPQVNPIQSNITSNIPLTAPSKQLGVAPSNAFKETQPQVISIQSSAITSNISQSHTAPNKQLGVAPSQASKEHSQTEKSLPNTSVEKETRDILATHLKTLGEAGIAKFKECLCLIKPPLKGGKIQTRHVKDKSVEDMVDLIIRYHTIRHARATVRNVLANMKENNLKMLIEKDFRTSSSRSNPNMLKQNIIIKVLKNLDAESLEEFKNALCSINPPRGCEQMTMNNLKDKSLEDIVEFILKYYTQRYGPEMIRNALKIIGKDKMWKMIQNDLKEGAKQERKMENEKKKGKRDLETDVDSNSTVDLRKIHVVLLK